MKDKILTLIIGILIGAILASAGFLVYSNVKGDSQEGSGQMQNGQMGEPPSMDGNSVGGGKGGTPPSMDGNSTPPEKPDDAQGNGQQSSNTATESNT